MTIVGAILELVAGAGFGTHIDVGIEVDVIFRFNINTHQITLNVVAI